MTKTQPKALQKILADPRVKSCVWETPDRQWWAELNKGWSFGGTGEAHCFSEATLRDVQRNLRWRVQPCECNDCTGRRP